MAAPGAGLEKMVSEHVGPDQITEIVSRWTGIPVQKLVSALYEW